MPKSTTTTTAQKRKYYAVAVGRRTGVFNSWFGSKGRNREECFGLPRSEIQVLQDLWGGFEVRYRHAPGVEWVEFVRGGGGSRIHSGGKFYAVGVGRNVGVYQSWDECKAEVRDFEGAKYKGSWSRREAEEWVVEKMEEHEKRRGGSRTRIPTAPVRRKTSSGSSSSLGQQRVEGSAASSFNLPHQDRDRPRMISCSRA